MARTVDPQRHEARRLQIIDAALTVISARGYEGATTAAICREAGIGSGTFFHYFPTKVELLLAILALGTAEVGELAERLADLDEPMAAIEAIVDQGVADAADPRVGGFVLAVAAVMHEPKVVAALQADEDAHRTLLTEWLTRAQEAGQVRTDLPATGSPPGCGCCWTGSWSGSAPRRTSPPSRRDGCCGRRCWGSWRFGRSELPPGGGRMCQVSDR